MKGSRLFIIISLNQKGATPIPITGNINNKIPVFSYQVALGKSVTIKAGQIPTIKAAFGTANAVRASNIGETRCASSTKTLSIAPPDVSITIE